MPSIIKGYEYDIFISYRQKDNKYDGWVTEFATNLKKELDATFKEDISVFFDINPTDGLLETHLVDRSLEGKLKCFIFIPVISRTYCDPKSFAWKYELCAFNDLSKTDQFGRDLKLKNGNVASRILPVMIHNLDIDDKALLKNELDIELRGIEFIYTEPGVNRPLRSSDNKNDNQNKTDYRNQVNKVANAVKEIMGSLKEPNAQNNDPVSGKKPERKKIRGRFKKNIINKIILSIIALVILISVSVLSVKNYSPPVRPIPPNTNKITSNPVAYNWFAKAEFRLNPTNKAGIDSCIFFLTRAIEADSNFALAYAELSRAYSFKNYFTDPEGGYMEKAYVAAQRSLFINPNLAEGYFARAYCIYNFQQKFPHEQVIVEYKKAIALKPDFDEAYHYLGIIYFHIGLTDEAFKAFNKALQINPDNSIARLDMTSAYFFSGERNNLEQMLDLVQRIPYNLKNSIVATFSAIALIDLGRIQEAEISLTEAIKKDTSDLLINSAMAILLAKKGDKEGALKRIEFCEKKNLDMSIFHHVGYNLAVAYALLGNKQKSVEELIWAKDNGFPNYTYFRDDPLLISLHQYPPYLELLNKLKIQWEMFRKIARE